MCPAEFGKAFLKQVLKWHPPNTIDWSFLGGREEKEPLPASPRLAIPLRYPFPHLKTPFSHGRLHQLIFTFTDQVQLCAPLALLLATNLIETR